MSVDLAPSFAIVGHPNEGKSSVVSTLAEDDSVRITPYPGETVSCQHFPVLLDGSVVLRFVDTPGFQSPRATLAWLKEHEAPDMLSAFVRAHEHDSEFRGECELFRPLIEGSGIIFVADASRPLRPVDRAEIEILRMTGIPRMAILNNKDETTEYLKSWREELRKYFNSVRVFNAHRATYAQRIALLESLKGIDQEGEEALTRVIEAFTLDWQRRMKLSAEIICDLIRQCTTCRITKRLPDGADTRTVLTELEVLYRQEISRIEREAHQAIKKLFKHNIFDYRMP
ncbi:MAG: GTPase domain-containing protein, partial [Desulfomonilia bacterium]|nr:GTPase domain-containing protein [Desulfomonilia bacterium]